MLATFYAITGQKSPAGIGYTVHVISRSGRLVSPSGEGRPLQSIRRNERRVP
jgi:hypothetical protein